MDYEEQGRTGLSKVENIKLVMELQPAEVSIYIGDTKGDAESAEKSRDLFCMGILWLWPCG